MLKPNTSHLLYVIFIALCCSLYSCTEPDKNLPENSLNEGRDVTSSKGIVKVAGKSLTHDEVNKIAIVAPDATVNIIKNFNVKEKIKVKTPDILENVIRCSNPVCITNSEQVNTKFYVVKKDPLKVKCHYCERVMAKEDIEIV